MKKESQLKSISYVMLIMLVGKLLSLVANQAYLSYFGSENEQLNIFSWVLQIPNYLFQALGTGLSSVVIPVFAAMCVTDRKKEANRFGSNIICIASLVTLGLIAVCMVLAQYLPQFTDFGDKAYATMALRIMIPVMLFYALTNIYQGILQSLNSFVAQALPNLPSGIVILGYLIFFADDFGVTGLLWAVVLGLFLQFAILVVPAHKAGFRFRPVLDFQMPSIRTAGRMMVPIVLGASAYQFNMFFNNTMMSNVAPESVSLFNFVQPLILTAVMPLVNAITSVIYPDLTAHVAQNDMKGFKGSLSDTMKGMIFLLTPISVGLIVLGEPLLNLISLHGKMTPQDISVEYLFLVMYSLCIVMLGLKEIVDRSFYSLRETRISAIVGVIIMVVNLIVGFVLSKFTPMGAAGIPFGYSLAVIVGTAFLIVKLRKKVGAFGGAIGGTVIKALLCSAVMAVVVYGAHWLLAGVFASGSVGHRAVLVFVPMLVGVVVYFALAFALKADPLVQFLGNFRGRKGGNHEGPVSD